jgi:hypothetical protein
VDQDPAARIVLHEPADLQPRSGCKGARAREDNQNRTGKNIPGLREKLYYESGMRVLSMPEGGRSGKTGFGWIELDGIQYTEDIIIHTGFRVSKRKKHLSKHLKAKWGHTPLTGEELDFISDEHPEVLYIGTGQRGAFQSLMTR